ncbi:MAG: RNA polymerase sigma factor [Muribaculaceae bacterium]|nr:RNA polymerase sigma factor [Muribaculaceae bacterium]
MKSDFLTHSYLALREKLFRSAIGFLKDEEDAKDAMQDTYLKLWSRNQIKSDSEARNKLFRALKNRCIDILRQQKHQNLLLEEADESVETYIDVDIPGYERFLISDLSERQRQIYRYVVQEGMEYETVARLTGRSVESIRTEICRIRKKIQCNLKRNDI